jgi:hypothetical protein
VANIHTFRLTGYPLSAQVRERFNHASATLKRLRRLRKKVVRAADSVYETVASWNYVGGKIDRLMAGKTRSEQDGG